jgi:RNA-directed DNA polymerase
MPALAAVVAPTSLANAWKLIYRRARPQSRNTQDVYGLSLNDFAMDEKANLRRLAGQLARNEFAFHPLRAHIVPKTNGSDRLICIPTVQDRIVQRALLNYLSVHYGARFSNEVSYGFLQHRDVKDAARVACALRTAHPWVLKTDITSFFDRIPRKELLAKLRKTIRKKSLHALLGGAINCEVHASDRRTREKIRALNVVAGTGLRQGMPLSPFFANLFLESLDIAITNAGIPAVRYADDLIFFADDEQRCYEIFEFCKKALGLLGLDVPALGPNSKSEIVPPLHSVEFLGLGLCHQNGNYELKLLPEQIKKIREDLLSLGSIPTLLSRKIKLGSLENALKSRIAGYVSAYECCTNLQELENSLHNIHQKILRRVYGEDGLQIKLVALSADARTFLNLA